MLTSQFAGSNFPPDTLVEFTDVNGKIWRGKVMRMLKNKARVATTDSKVFKVPYTWLRLLSVPACNMTAEEVENTAIELMKKHGLDDWRFEFDVASSRGGLCNYRTKLIKLSMSYAMKAMPSEVKNTILHEIAHALVGAGHKHNNVWQAMARAIGCSGDRCHSVEHTQSKYVGHCECNGKERKRDRLTSKARNSYCIRCGKDIEWSLRGIENDCDFDDTVNQPESSHTPEPVSSDELSNLIDNFVGI